MRKQAFLYFLFAIALSGCARPASAPLPTITPIAGTAFVLPPTPLPSPTPAGTPTPFSAFQVNPAVDGLKLRVGPGFLFDALRLLSKDDVLTVAGKAPGGEWIQVTTRNGIQGWVFAELLDSDVDLQAIPVIQPEGLPVIRGRVFDVLGSPVAGVGFELKLEGAAISTTAITDASGAFFAFLPPGASGTWTVTHTSVACKSNVWADATCSTYKPGYSGLVEPQTRTVTLPQTDVLEFIWR